MFNSEQEIIDKSIKGDIDAFEELVKKYEKKVYTIAYRLIGNSADASDMAQEAFIKVYKALPKFRGDSSFKTWIIHIVTNVCKDELRKRKMTTRSLDDDSLSLEDRKAVAKENSNLQGPEEHLMQKEDQQKIQQCLNTLSEEHKLILVLREIQGYSYEEIAGYLECTLGTVKSRLSRARLAFKDIYLDLINKSDKNGKEGELWIVKK